MADPAPPQSLLDQATSNPPGALMSLLSPIVSGGAIAPSPGAALSPQQQSQALPAWLAFASSLARAGAPTLGPPTPTGNAIVGGLDAGYGAALQAGMLPVLQGQMQREAQSQNVGLAEQMLKYQKDMAMWGVQKSMIDSMTGNANAPPAPIAPIAPVTPGSAAPAPGTSAAPAAGAPGTQGMAAPLNAQQLAMLPDFQRLPDSSRVPAILTAAKLGMGADEAAQWARMLMQESGGNQLRADGSLVTSPSGAIGVGQVMPATFADMAQKYGITGKPGDLMANLEASGRYFNEGVLNPNGGGLYGATIRYNGGPKALASYMASGSLPAETADYVAQTKAPMPAGVAQMLTMNGRQVPVLSAPGNLFAGPGAPINIPESSPGAGDAVTNADVQAILQGMRGAGAGMPGQPGLPGGVPAMFAGPGAPTNAGTSGSVAPVPPRLTMPPPGMPPPAPGNPNLTTPGDPLVFDPIMKMNIPQSVQQLARMAFMSGDSDGAFQRYGAAVQQWNTQQQQQRAQAVTNQWVPAGPGIQASPVTGETKAAPTGEVTGRFLSPDEIANDPAFKDKGLDPRMSYWMTMNPDGSPVKIEPVAPRQSGQQIDQEAAMRKEYQQDPTVEPYYNAQGYLGRMRATLAAQSPTRPLTTYDDYDLLHQYAKLNDPNAVAKVSEQDELQAAGGVPGYIKQETAKLFGGAQGTLTDDQRQWLLASAESIAGGNEAQAYQTALQKRRIAEMDGLRPDAVAPLWNLSQWAQAALRATPAGAASPAPPTAPGGTSPNLPRPGVVMPSAPIPGPRELAPAPTGGPTLPPAPTPGTQQPGAPAQPTNAPTQPAAPTRTSDALTPDRVAAMTGLGIANALDDVRRNPGNYSAHDLEMLRERGNALARR